VLCLLHSSKEPVTTVPPKLLAFVSTTIFKFTVQVRLHSLVSYDSSFEAQGIRRCSNLKPRQMIDSKSLYRIDF
jgi:hypothetical protein